MARIAISRDLKSARISHSYPRSKRDVFESIYSHMRDLREHVKWRIVTKINMSSNDLIFFYYFAPILQSEIDTFCIFLPQNLLKKARSMKMQLLTARKMMNFCYEPKYSRASNYGTPIYGTDSNYGTRPWFRYTSLNRNRV